MSLSASSVAEAIAALDVTGLTIRGLDKAPQAINPSDCPLVFPEPGKFLALEEAVQLSFGPNALWKYTYLVTYRYVQGPVGKGRRVSDSFPDKVDGYAAFIKAVTRNAQMLGHAHVSPASTPEWGVLGDPSEQQFEAADLALRVVEYSGD